MDIFNFCDYVRIRWTFQIMKWKPTLVKRTPASSPAVANMWDHTRPRVQMSSMKEAPMHIWTLNLYSHWYSSNCVYIFFAQNLILLISFIFYNGSEGFFNMLFASNNLQLFVVYFLIMIISLCIPKKFIISIILSVILIIANIFLLANLNFFGDI